MVHEIKESSLQKSPTNSHLAELAEDETDGQEVVGSNLTDEIYFVLCNFKSVRQSDRNASDFFIVKNPTEPQLGIISYFFSVKL